MAKKTQIDRAIDDLMQKSEAINRKAMAEIAGIEAAIAALQAQRPKVRKPRAVKPAAVVNG